MAEQSPEEIPVLKKFVYRDGDKDRALRGYTAGESPDGLFFIIRRPHGDEVWVAKSAVRLITPVHDEEVRR